LNSNAGEVEASACAGQGWLYKIEFARRHAAGDEQQVSLCGLGERAVEGSGIVRGGGQNPGFAARGGCHRGQHGGIRVADLTGSGRGLHGHEFIACGENRHTGPDKNVNCSVAAGRGQGNLRELHRGPGSKQFVSLASLCSLGHDILAWRNGAGWEQPDPAPGHLDVLDLHHSVGACGNRGPGHDLPGCAWRQRPSWSLSGTGGANEVKEPMCGSLKSPAGKAVLGGTCEWRLVAVGTETLGEHPACRQIKPHALRRGPQPAQLGGVIGNQRRGLLAARQCGTHAMDCRGFRQTRLPKGPRYAKGAPG
jgi:hypothetical protein